MERYSLPLPALPGECNVDSPMIAWYSLRQSFVQSSTAGVMGTGTSDDVPR
jgi:hypothetical protein